MCIKCSDYLQSNETAKYEEPVGITKQAVIVYFEDVSRHSSRGPEEAHAESVPSREWNNAGHKYV
jgi:hypothetical protein